MIPTTHYKLFRVLYICNIYRLGVSLVGSVNLARPPKASHRDCLIFSGNHPLHSTDNHDNENLEDDLSPQAQNDGACEKETTAQPMTTLHHPSKPLLPNVATTTAPSVKHNNENKSNHPVVSVPPATTHTGDSKKDQPTTTSTNHHDHGGCKNDAAAASTTAVVDEKKGCCRSSSRAPQHVVLAAIDESLRNLSDTTDRLVIPTTRTRQPLSSTTTTSAAAVSPHRTAEEVAARHAPPGMERPFAQLYRALAPALLLLPPDEGDGVTTPRRNRSVFVQGPRGCGKSLLVQSCLSALVHEHGRAATAASSSTTAATIPYRPVYLNAALHVPTQRHHPNAGAGAVVDEILRQLLAHCSTSRTTSSTANAAAESGEQPPPPRKRQRTELLRLRRTNFANHLQLLNEILQIAAVDDTPVLFVLDHVAQFPPLLLYHLLDRLAGASTGGVGDAAAVRAGSGGSSHALALVGMTSHALTSAQAAGGGMLEKRIVSRVEGTTSVVQLRSMACSAITLLQSKLHPTLHHLVESLGGSSNNNNGTGDDHPIAEALQRQERLGQPARWFCRLFSLALASCREDLAAMAVPNSSNHNDDDDDDHRNNGGAVPLPNLIPHVRDALRDFGVIVDVIGRCGGGTTTDAIVRRLDPTARSVLRDLSLPQLLVVLAARRIVARSHRRRPTPHTGGSSSNNNHKNSGSGTAAGGSSHSTSSAGGGPVVLTLQGILNEVSHTLYSGNPPPNATPLVLKRAFLELIDMAVLRPALDHSGIGPWQYYERASVISFTDNGRVRATLDWEQLLRLPLHLTLDAHRDILAALEGKVLAAPASVLEWGRRIH